MFPKPKQCLHMQLLSATTKKDILFPMIIALERTMLSWITGQMQRRLICRGGIGEVRIGGIAGKLRSTGTNHRRGLLRWRPGGGQPKPASPDASGQRFGKAASAVELAQAFLSSDQIRKLPIEFPPRQAFLATHRCLFLC